MIYTLSCPSKTFLLGEYLILQQGPALILNTEPRFSLIAHTNTQGKQNDIDPQSPAGRYIHDYKKDFGNTDIQFTDPHQGAGGLGASTAQFLLCYALHKQLLEQPFDVQTPEQIQSLLNIYRHYAWQGEGVPPSGADLLAQFSGQLCLYTKDTALQAMAWPFPDLAICLIRTGKKLATHEHLRQLQYLDTHQLASAMTKAISAIETRSGTEFVDALREYAEELEQLGLVAEHTQTLLQQLPNELILAAKGCGGMGADIIAVCLAVDKLPPFHDWASKQQLHIIADQSQLSPGLH